MVAFPGCKINLGLHILRKRPDGFHDIETAFYPVPWSDVLEVLPSEKFSFSFSGLTVPGAAEDNLCLRAYRLLAKDFTLPAIQGHLHKVVPMGAGLGGGSADGAHALRLLNQVASLNLSSTQLHAYAGQLGSDCSFFLKDGPAMGKGRGEILEPLAITLKGYFLVILSPQIHVSTADAYAAAKPAATKEVLGEVLSRPMTAWRDHLINDFETPVFNRFPQLSTLKSRLYECGAIYAAMSGSGSALFGFFKEDIHAEDRFPGLIGWSGWL